MNVLSLFDGMSCGQIALKEIGITPDKYYASEIDKHAIAQTMLNFPDTIQLGSVVDIDVSKLEPIQVILGGSPCQSFSFAGKRKGMVTKDNIEIHTLEKYLELKSQGFEFEGQSYLFWEYMRILTEVRKVNPDVKFLLENVEMGAKWEFILSEAIGINGVHINSALVSAQNRKRIYWSNIKTKQVGLFGDIMSDIPQPLDKGILLKDILESEVDEKYYLSEKALKFVTDETRLKKKYTQNGSEAEKSLPHLAKNQTNWCCDFICHNTMPRSSTTGKGGTGHLSRNDGKTYCLDTGQTNAVEYAYRQDTPILESAEKYQCLRSNPGGKTRGVGLTEITSRIRRLTPTECARLQTVPSWYIWTCSNTQQYKMLGNGWNINTITHILSFLH